MNTLNNSKTAILNDKKEIVIEFSHCSEENAEKIVNCLNYYNDIVDSLESLFSSFKEELSAPEFYEIESILNKIRGQE